MKQRLIVISFTAILLFFQLQANSEPVDYSMAKAVATGKIALLQKAGDYHITDRENLFTGSDGKTLFFLFDLIPTGYIIVSGDTDLPPVIAYSFLNSAGSVYDESNVLIRMVKADLTNRITNMNLIAEMVIHQNRNAWDELKNGIPDGENSSKFQQWPPEGTTATGGWLESNWHQSPPYNDFCPMDPVTNQRSVAGCPATAMAMILNYYENINGTFFTDDDDYYHAYAGRNYWIDNDYVEIDFPSFPVLDLYLDTIGECYANGDLLKDSGKAALTFACGVAAHQVYTSQVSGTFGVNQALMAYERFGFTDVSFFGQNDTTVFATLMQNMMDARPAHLAVVDPGWTMGHNVVVDGYNTDDFFHINFGWGGSYNGWYKIPEGIPYGLTVIEGVIADIAYPPVNTALTEVQDDLSVEITPNPAYDRINIKLCLQKPAEIQIEILDLTGSLLFTEAKKISESGIHTETIDLKGFCSDGMILCRLRVNDRQITKRIILR